MDLWLIDMEENLPCGIALAIIGSALVAIVPFFPSLVLLMTGRFLMGLGACAGIKIATTLIGDLYNEQESRKITPYLILSFAIVPAIAIFIGGLLTQHFGWASCLYFLLCYCVFQLMNLYLSSWFSIKSC